MSEVAARMGWASAFSYDTPADIWREHARLTAYQNEGARVLNLSAQATLTNRAYEAMEPFVWGGQPFADGRFSTPNGRARLVPVRQMDLQGPLPDWPLTLNTGRYRDQWHTMTRTGLAPKLARHREEPLVEIHADDAVRFDLKAGDLAKVSTPQGPACSASRSAMASVRAKSSRRSTGPTRFPPAGAPACSRARSSIRFRASRATSRPRPCSRASIPNGKAS
jgi:assimilatory nitrate reductase catalytic subunit